MFHKLQPSISLFWLLTSAYKMSFSVLPSIIKCENYMVQTLSTHSTKQILTRRFASAYLSHVTCLDNQLASEAGTVISPFIKWVTQSAYTFVPILHNSPSAPSWSEGFVGARWGLPRTSSLPADARPFCCFQGTRKGGIVQQSAGAITVSHVGRIAADWDFELRTIEATPLFADFCLLLQRR